MKKTNQLKAKNLKRLVIPVFMAFLSIGIIQAQTKTVSGVVKDETGETIIGASIVIKGTKAATATGINGDYKINVPANGKILVVSYVGMDKQEIPITSSVINVILKSNVQGLNEVVVIGYGTQKKKDLTGSISSVDEKQLKDIPVSNVAEALTGKLPGVQVTTTEGSPDADIKIRVRGGGSITQSNSPLYVVDGFIKDDIRDIAPSEIQDITVLKDASSTAIYGSRGANGVIIITTKNATQGKISVSYNGYVGYKEVSKLLSVLTPYQFAQKQYERALLGNTVSSDYESYFGNYGDIDLFNYMKGTNWQQETFGKPGYTQNHTLSLSGGTKTFSYMANYSYMYDKAIMYMSNFNRNNISLKLKYNPLKWLHLDFSSRYAATIVNGSGANDQTGMEKSTSDSRVKNAVIYTPIPLKNMVLQSDNPDARASLYSPLEATQDNNRYQNSKDFNLNGGITIDILKNLTLNSTFGYTNTYKIDNRFYGLTSYYVTNGGSLKRNNAYAPATFLQNTDYRTFENSNVLNYKKDNLFEGQNLNVILGQETYIRSSDYIFKDLEAFPQTYMSQDVWNNLSQGTNVSTIHFYNPDERMFSYFGRLNYDIFDRYLLAVTFRADGSSKFSNGNEWGYFPSLSAGWRISEEPFMQAAQNWLSNLKLRASYGEAGNNNIDNTAFKRVYTSSHSNYLPTNDFPNILTAGSTMANPDLKWETTVTRNVGLDFGVLNNRLNGSVEAYSNNTYNALILMNIGGIGYTSQWQNTATTLNKGIEVSLNAALVQTKDFNLNFAFNISMNRNEVVKLGNLTSYPFNEAWTSYSEASNSFMVSPGNPVGLIYGYVNNGMYSADDFSWTGTKWVMNAAKYTNYDAATKTYSDAKGNKFVDNSSIDGLTWGPGAMKLKDMDGDGKITLADKALIGNTNPKHFGAFSFTATYKGWDASLNFNWVYGNNIYNASKIELTTEFYKYRNMLGITANSYTQIDWATGNRITDPAILNTMNANANMWASPTGRYATTSWAIEDGSFLRLNNMTIGYTIPKKITKKFYVQQLRVYATGYNLLLLTKYSGYDPEVDTRRSTPATPGVDYSAYPKSRSYNIGVNITF